MFNWLQTSAGRLYTLIEQAHAYVGDFPHDYCISDVWIAVLEYEDTPELRLKAHTQVLSLIYSIQKDLNIYSSSSAAIQFHAMDEIIQSFNSLSPSGNWENFSEKLNKSFLASLATLGNFIASKKALTELSHNELDEIREIIVELLDLVSKSSLHDELKYILIDLANELHNAVIYYRISGTQGLERAIERTIGTLDIHRHRANTEVEKNIFIRFFDSTLKIAESINTCNGSLQVIQQLISTVSESIKSLPGS